MKRESSTTPSNYEEEVAAYRRGDLAGEPVFEKPSHNATGNLEAPQQGPADTEEQRRERLPRVVRGYARSVRYLNEHDQWPVDSGFAGILERAADELERLRSLIPSAERSIKLDDIEQYRLQMAGISTAALGYWKEGDDIHPDYDTPAIRDVAKLYAKYAALFEAAHKPASSIAASEKPQGDTKNANSGPRRPKPTIAELEWILAAPDGVFVTAINPDGSVRADIGPKFYEMFPDARSGIESAIQRIPCRGCEGRERDLCLDKNRCAKVEAF